jgi:hypothetical protein
VCDVLGSKAVMVSCVMPRQPTVRDLEQKFTPNEVRRAKIAKQLMRNTQQSASKLMFMLRVRRTGTAMQPRRR